MNEETFGSYLKKLRTEHKPFISQEALANAVGRKKMTISQFESDKNAPPQGELLNDIISALKISSGEEEHLRFLVAQTRNTIPSDIKDYFFENPAICEAIRAAQKAHVDNFEWAQIKKSFESGGAK